MADNFFSLTISEKYITISDAKKTGEFLEISNLIKIDSVPIFFTSDLEKNQEEQAEKIKKAINNLGINKKNVNIIIPDSLTYNQILTMPDLNEKELISAIKYQADQFIPIPINEANIDLEIIDEDKQNKKLLILIVAADKKLIKKVQNTIELAGLIPESIETEISGNLRFYNDFFSQINKNSNKKNYLLINFGFNSSLLTYINGEKNIPTKNHNIIIGYELFKKELMINANIDENKTDEILKNFSFNHQISIPVETIINPILQEFINEIKKFIEINSNIEILFLNYISLFPALPDFIKKNLNIEAKIFNLLPILKTKFNIDLLSSDLPFFISSFGGNLK